MIRKSLVRYKASRFNVMRTFEGTVLLSNSRSGATVAVEPEEIAPVKELLRGAVSGPGSPALLVDLIEQGFLVEEGCDELGALDVLHAAINDQRELEVIILPTEDCNLRCTYCYESFAKGAMQPEVRERLKAYFRKAIPRIERLRISWFGGEPLFAFPVMVEIAECVVPLCEANAVELESSIVTNGYLLDDEKLALLRWMNCTSYQVTIDGDAQTHDRTRRLADGAQTYEVVWANLRRLKALKGEHQVVVRANVHRDNMEGVRRLTDDFTREFGADPRFTLGVYGVWDNEKPGDGAPLVLENREEALGALKVAALRKNTRDCIGFNVFGPGARTCYAARANSLVVGADGMLYKCTLAFEEPRNQLGTIGEDGELSIDAERFALWTAQDYRTDETCRACFYVPSCFGSACPLARIEEGRRPCPPEKTHLTATMRIMYEVHQAQARGEMMHAKGGESA